jgi:hypothetical protein
MNRPTVLILSSDPAFSREITAHWPHGPHHDQPRSSDDPEFTVLEEGFSCDLKESQYDLAIADCSSAEKKGAKKSRSPIPNPAELKQSLFAAGKPAILLHSDLTRDFCSRQGPVIELRREAGIWPALTVLIGREILRRRQAESRASEAETICAVVQNEATLGRYMVEMRTNVNDALTTSPWQRRTSCAPARPSRDRRRAGRCHPQHGAASARSVSTILVTRKRINRSRPRRPRPESRRQRRPLTCHDPVTPEVDFTRAPPLTPTLSRRNRNPGRGAEVGSATRGRN